MSTESVTRQGPALSVRLTETPMSPLYKRHFSPDHELKALVGGSLCSEIDESWDFSKIRRYR
jgi:hypothetical protein